MDEVVAYLRARYSQLPVEADVSMEEGKRVGFFRDIFSDAFGDIGNIYKARHIPRAPWNDPKNKEWFTPESLDKREFLTQVSTSPVPVSGWLSVQGVQIAQMMDQFLDVELNTYRALSNIAFESGMRYLEWAQRITVNLDKLNPDEVLRNRPKSPAEKLGPTSVRLLGMRNQVPLVETVPFRGDTLSMFKVPVRPEINSRTERFLVTPELAKLMCSYADKFDQFADGLDAYFLALNGKIEKLKTFRELAGADDKPHDLVRFLDAEMMVPYITGLHQALFYRARDLADFLRMMVCSNFR